MCGHPHRGQCGCGCTIFELDNGTDISPTRTGNIIRCVWEDMYEGQYYMGSS